MSKNFLWSIVLIVLNIFILFLNYSKDFTLPLSFFIEINQMIAFLIGMLYANQYRRFNLKYILGIVSNSLIFTTFITLIFGIYEAPISFSFSVLMFVFVFLAIFLGYSLFYVCFCPKRRKKKKKKVKKVKRKNNTYKTSNASKVNNVRKNNRNVDKK